MNPSDLISVQCQKSARLRGRDIPYTVTAEEYPLYSPQGELEATMFTYSYLHPSNDARRPVVFAYNGGPGSDSTWLHFGLLGPRRVPVAEPDEGLAAFPCRLEDNEEFLIDACDIVMIDPVGTGYTQVLSEEAARRYYGVQGDARSFARLIEDWIDRRGRWDSPVYLLGESYGTIRNVALADALCPGICLAGIISVGTSLNVGRPELHVEPSVRRFEAYAAAAWYHKREGKPDLRTHLAQAGQFAYGPYARALLHGSRLPREEVEDILRRVQYFTGMEEGYLRRSRLRVDQEDFVRLICPGEVVSVYDARIKMPLGRGGEAPASHDDEAQTAAVAPAFAAARRKYACAELGIGTGRPYRRDMMDIAAGWDYKTGDIDTMALLERLMRRKKDLRVLFVNGCYDLQSTADFVTYYLAQYDIPPERAEVRVYESGHMTYFGKPFAQLCADLRQFILPVQEGEERHG